MQEVLCLVMWPALMTSCQHEHVGSLPTRWDGCGLEQQRDSALTCG